ncbi:MAG: MotA/TolQ/ExbB proton channel family protein [Myxococcota bacterium]|jgi:biopolymer transport protein ExbB/TolQ|nr:MotA/TolQ/ExbB proton channel family protein [Myxococcota bacterium]
MGFIAQSFKEGGLMMWPILFASFLVYGIAIERIIFLWFRAATNKEEFVRNALKIIYKGNLSAVVDFVSTQNSPLARIVHAGLLKVRGKDEDVQVAMDEAALSELPKIEKRTPYLAMFGNVAMLLGLLGTISGMIISFAAVANAEASEKAAKLALGISEAMNCTAFGLLVAIPALLFYAFLQGKTQAILDDINEGTVRVLNAILAHRDKLVASAKDE